MRASTVRCALAGDDVSSLGRAASSAPTASTVIFFRLPIFRMTTPKPIISASIAPAPIPAMTGKFFCAISFWSQAGSGNAGGGAAGAASVTGSAVSVDSNGKASTAS